MAALQFPFREHHSEDAPGLSLRCPCQLFSRLNHLLNIGNNFSAGDRMHAAEIERAFPQKTRAALDMMPKNAMALAQRTGSPRFGRPENRDRGNPQQCREMHCPGIVSKQ
jgi:hypothetical protein